MLSCLSCDEYAYGQRDSANCKCSFFLEKAAIFIYVYKPVEGVDVLERAAPNVNRDTEPRQRTDGSFQYTRL